MKKFLTIALALCMVFAFAACGSGDDETRTDGTTPTDLNAPAVSPTPTPDPEPLDSLEINGVAIIRNGQLTNVGYRGFTYADGKLTMDSVEIENLDSSKPVISFSGGDLELVVTGECSLTATEGVIVISGGEGDALTISGDGSLTVSAEDAAAFDLDGELTVSCSLNVTGMPACSAETVTAADGFAVTENDEATLTVSAAA